MIYSHKKLLYKWALPALLASASRMWISVQSASQCSRYMWRKRAWVRDTLFRRDKSATVCSHSFQPLNQSVRIPTWSRNIMACLLGKENRKVRIGRVRLLFQTDRESLAPHSGVIFSTSPGIPSDLTEGPSHDSSAAVTGIQCGFLRWCLEAPNTSTAEGNGTKRERLFSLWHGRYHIIFALMNQQTNKNKMNHYMPLPWSLNLS